jgi:hypothetical protein
MNADSRRKIEAALDTNSFGLTMKKLESYYHMDCDYLEKRRCHVLVEE